MWRGCIAIAEETYKGLHAALSTPDPRDERIAELEREIQLISSPHDSIGNVISSLRTRLAAVEEAAKYHVENCDSDCGHLRAVLAGKEE